MSKEKIQKLIKKERNNNYLARDFDSYRADLVRYAKSYFPDKIQDFSEASLGGLFLDMNAIIGDNLSFYLDHQFRELDPSTAIEPINIESHLKNAGVKIQGASPAVVEVNFLIEIFGIKTTNGDIVPDRSILPTIKSGTVLRSNSGINFLLAEDVDFGEQNEAGNLTAEITVSSSPGNSSNGTFILSKKGICISGEERTENIVIPNQFIPFRTVTLASPNITEIISVKDSNSNVYYEVDYLTQTNIFATSVSYESNVDNVEGISSLELIPVPYRYVVETNLSTRTTNLRFGSGNADSLDDDIIPDPSDVSIPLYGKSYFSRISIDPNRLLETQSLGISPVNTVLTINYRYGGGSSHNVGPNSIKTIKSLERVFPNAFQFSSLDYPFVSPNDFNSITNRVINSLDVLNPSAAIGGSQAPTINDLKSSINSSRFSQSRVVTKQDLLARTYSLPAKFGRVYRAAVSDNPNSNNSPVIHIASIDSNNHLTMCADTLKRNLSKYLNEFRLFSDSYDILDAYVINFRVKYKVLTNPNLNKVGLIKKINTEIANFLKISNFQINQPIILDDLKLIVLNQSGVISITDFLLENVNVDSNFLYAGRKYSGNLFNFESSNKNGVFLPLTGGIFELRYPNVDILGVAI
jgi:hypothetical protein